MNTKEVIADAIRAGVLHLTGKGRVKISRPAVRVLSALLGRMAEEWDRHEYELSMIGGNLDERQRGQREYARHASGSIRSAISRLASNLRIEQLESGYDYATSCLAVTDADEPLETPVVRRK